MGEVFEHVCVCGFRATVSGGRDAGMCALTETVVCEECGSLSDRLTHEHTAQRTGGPGSRFAPVAPAPCEACGADSARIRPWFSGDPYPSCARPLGRSGDSIVLWD